MFAIDFLSDILGKEIGEYEGYHVTSFANYIVYQIYREIDLSDHFSRFSVESMVKNGVFGNGSGLGYGEHIIQINLHYQ